jgi:hypothetical protein
MDGKLSGQLLRAMEKQPADASIEVIVASFSSVKVPKLPRLDREKSRDSEENVAILEERQNIIDDIASARKLDRYELEQLLESFRRPILEEFPLGNALRVEVNADEIRSLASRAGVLAVSLARDTAVPPNVLWGRTALHSDQWRNSGYNGDVQFLYLGLLDTGVRAAHQQFTSSGGGTFGLHRGCAYGNTNCLNSPVNA